MAERCSPRGGFGTGDRVVLLLPNGLSFVELVHAVPRVGAILVPLNTRLTPTELSWQVDDAGARLVVFDDSTDALAADRLCNDTRAHAAELHGQGQRLPAVEDGGLDRVHSIIYTSGTTGRPKGAMLTFGNHLWSAIGSALNLGLIAQTGCSPACRCSTSAGSPYCCAARSTDRRLLSTSRSNPGA